MYTTNRTIRRSAAMVLAGITLMTPSLASADPSITALIDGQPVMSTATAAAGQQVTLQGAGCTPVEGAAYMGEYVSTVGDPWLQDENEHYELEVDGSGAFTWDLELPEQSTESVSFNARWYCSPTRATGIDDPNLVWISPQLIVTIESPSAAPNGMMRMAATDSSFTQTQSLADGNRVTVMIDQDALPLVDRVNIHGEVAAALKAQVDARSTNIAEIQRLNKVFLGRYADTSGLAFYENKLTKGQTMAQVAKAVGTSTEHRKATAGTSDAAYVDALFQNALGRPAGHLEAAYWAQQLGQGLSRWELGHALANTAEVVDAERNGSYVSATYHVLGQRTARDTDIARFADRLAGGELKVAIVEDVALTIRPAGSWVLDI